MKSDKKQKKKFSVRKIILSIVAVLVILIVGVVVYIRYEMQINPPPQSINMGSDMNGMNMGAMPENMKMGESSSSATPLTSLKLGETNAPEKDYTITAEVVKHPGLPDEWTYNGKVPGPEIRVTQGDHVHITFKNNLPVATSIHWHGIPVPNVSDGVSGLTQDAVKPGQTYTYDFIAKETGTYWYHSHQHSSEQEPKGLFGTLIVDPQNPIHYDHDYTLMYHDSLNKPATVLAIIGQRIQQLFGRQVPQGIVINNKDNEVLQARPGETVRVRIVNGSGGDMEGTPIKIVPLGVSYKVVSLDGHDVHQPQAISQKVLEVGQGQRYDLVFTMPSSGIVKLIDIANNETATLGQGQLSMPQNLKSLPVFDITQYGSPTAKALKLSSHFDQTYPITLGSKPGFRFGSIQLIHTINGKAFPDTPTINVKEGQVVHLHIVNKTDEYHPMHLHGHIFSLLAMNGKEVTGSPIQMDTVLVSPHQTADVAFVANNPGLWMFHCHVLIHASFGMDMMVSYPNISTPFTIGTKSGNFPD